MHWAVTALPNSKAKGTGFRSRKMRSRVQFSVSFHWTVYFCAIVKWEVERHTVPQNGPGSWIFGWCLTKDHRIWRSAPPYAPLWFRDDFVFVRFTGQKELCFKTPEKWLTPCPEQFPQYSRTTRWHNVGSSTSVNVHHNHSNFASKSP